MALPKGFGSGSGGASRADVENMIGRRIENYTGIITLSYLGAFFATVFGTMEVTCIIHGHTHQLAVILR